MLLLLEPCPESPNCVSTEAADEAHHAEPWPWSGDPAAALARLKGIVLAIPGSALVSEDQRELRFTFTSRVWRFVDDVHLVLGDGVVQYRSASRVGWGDMGVNRARMQAIGEAWLAPSPTPPG